MSEIFRTKAEEYFEETGSEESLKRSKSFVESFYGSLNFVSNYMKNHQDMILSVIDKPATPNRDNALKQLWLRALAWVLSLEALNETKYYQAIASGNRALLEITVDILLLHDDKTDETGKRMFLFARSEKMKAAESVVNYYRSKGLRVPETYKPQETFYDNYKIGVQDMRNRLWQTSGDLAKGKDAEHPRRWTKKTCRKILKR